MSFLSRTARWAGTLLIAAGMLGASAPVLASDLTSGTTSAAVAGTVINTLTAPLVPQPTVAVPTPAVLVDTAVASTPKARFASLSAAVAAQDGLADDQHLRCLAGAVYFESKGEPLAGQLAVAQVILNRTRSGRFADSVCGVVLQRGQFGFVRGGAIPAIDESRAAYRTAVAVAKVAMQEAWEQTANDALYFNGVRAGHGGTRRVAVIGGHAFYR